VVVYSKQLHRFFRLLAKNGKSVQRQGRGPDRRSRNGLTDALTLDRAGLRAGQPDLEEFVKFLQGEAAVEQVFTLSDLAGFGLDRMELVLEGADQLGQHIVQRDHA